MAMFPINPPPGLLTNQTPYEAGARWRDGNGVRWVNRELREIGGWVSSQADFTGTTEPIRRMLSWRDNSSLAWLGLGSADKLWAMDESETAFDITPATLSWNPGGNIGYGSGAYGSGRYGTSRPDVVTQDADAYWTFDTWGENLVAVHNQDGRLFEWTAGDTVGEALVVANAPTGNLGVIVTEERHAVLLGAGGDPRRIEWSDRENLTEWTPSPTNSAGGFNLQTDGRIIAGVNVPGGVLILTTSDAHLMSFVGGEFVYGIENAGAHAGVVSALSVVAVPGGAVWLHDNEVYSYTGSIQSVPTDVYDKLFTDTNLSRPVLVHAGWNEAHEEVWFFVPTQGSVEPNRAVAWSLRQGDPYWTLLDIERTAFARSTVDERPYAVSWDDTLGRPVLYVHEAGFLDDGQPRTGVYAETGAMEVGQGDRVFRCRKVFQDALDPEINIATPNLYPYTLTFKLRQAPGAEERIAGPYTMNQTRGYTDVRFRARQVRMRIDSVEDSPWTVGKLRLEGVAGGRR